MVDLTLLAQAVDAVDSDSLTAGDFLASLYNLFIAAAIVMLLLFWAYQFAQLMLLRDRDMPGKLDKAIWAAAFILLFFITPFAFFFWKRAALAMSGRATRQGDVLKAINMALGTADDQEADE